jgi:carbonic anhydrase
MSSIDRLLAEARARAHKAAAEQGPQPRLRAAILTCMDARIDPVSLFGLGRGDAHVIRNAGARATPDVLRSLALSQAILGTREVLVLGHTGCGLFERSEAELAEAIRIKSGHRPGMEMGAFHDLDQAVLETVEELRQCPFLAYRDGIHGFVYELDAGSVRPVAEEKTDRSSETRSRPMTGLEMLRADALSLKRARRR